MSCDTDETVYVAIYRGDTLALAVDLDAAGGEVDTTGWSFLCQLRDADGGLVATLTATSTAPETGGLELGLTAEETGLLAPADYVWDLQATDALGSERTLAEGQLRVREDVSR